MNHFLVEEWQSGSTATEEIKNKLKELHENREKLSINTLENVSICEIYSLSLFLTIMDFPELLGADAIKEKIGAIFTTACIHCRGLTF